MALREPFLLEPVRDEGLDVAIAAAMLGITPTALRKRIRRGSVTAWKVDGEWRVRLPAGEPAGEPSGQDAGYPVGHPAGSPPVPDAARELIATLQRENAWLRAHGDALAATIAALAARPGSPPALPPVSPSAKGWQIEPASSHPTPCAWWRRVIRAIASV